jgi:hypothetical protein
VLAVLLLYPNGQRQDILLAGIPRVGERVRLANGVNAPPLVIEQVTWIEGSGRTPEPEVILSVRAAPDPA